MNAPLPPQAVRKPLPPIVVEKLKALFGERFSTSDAVRDHHGRDESPYPPLPPDAVVFARTTEEVAELVRIAADHRVPVIPYGVGTSLEGHLLALEGGISVDLSQMNARARGEPGRPDRHRAGRRHPQAAEQRDQGRAASSSRSTRAPTPRSAAWPPPARRAPTPCATARCARTCSA